jgi:hypothetical protein
MAVGSGSDQRFFANRSTAGSGSDQRFFANRPASSGSQRTTSNQRTFEQQARARNNDLSFTPGQRINDRELMQLLYAVGFRGQGLITAFAVAKAESSGNSRAHNPNRATGDDSYGLFQINMIGRMGPERRRAYRLSSNSDLFDPVRNAQIAFDMSNQGRNWTPWSVHPDARSRGGSGRGYERHLETARQTFAGLQRTGGLSEVRVRSSGAQARATGGPGAMEDPSRALSWQGGGAPAGGPGMSAFAPGPGGGMFLTDMGALPVPDTRTIDEIIAQDFGYLAWATDHPELGPLLREAADGGWDQATLRGALFATDWWQHHSQSVRGWQQLVAEDPAEARARLERAQESIADAAATIGLDLEPSRIAEIAEYAVSEGWDATQIQRALLGEAKYDPGKQPGGQLGATIQQATEMSRRYMVGIAPAAAFDWAKRIAAGLDDEVTMQNYFSDLAKGRFPHLSAQIEAGRTPQQLFDPYVQQAAQMLEMPSGSIDLMGDTRFQGVLNPVQDAQGAMRSMTMTEHADYLRQLPDWNKTYGARQRAAELGETITDLFGKVR